MGIFLQIEPAHKDFGRTKPNVSSATLHGRLSLLANQTLFHCLHTQRKPEYDQTRVMHRVPATERLVTILENRAYEFIL